MAGQRRIDIVNLTEKSIAIDGYNLLITVEAAIFAVNFNVRVLFHVQLNGIHRCFMPGFATPPHKA